MFDLRYTAVREATTLGPIFRTSPLRKNAIKGCVAILMLKRMKEKIDSLYI
jgi:hypothetical protein